MPARPYAAITTIPTPDGLVYVRKSWAAKQSSYLLILDGPAPAISLLLPDWRPRSPTSTRTQVTPPTPATTTSELMTFAETQIPVWCARANGKKPVTTALVTIADAIAATEKAIGSTIRPSSLSTYRKQWKRISKYIPTSTKLSLLTRERVQGLISRLADRGTAATGIRNAVGALHRALTPAIEAGLVNVTIFERLNTPTAVARPRSHLSREQRDHLLAVAATEGRDIGLLVAIGALAGLRRSEILALTWKDVDLDAQVLKVQNGATFKTKSGKNRIVPLCTQLVTLLREQRPANVDPTVYVVKPEKPHRAGQARWVFTKSLRRVAIDAGVPWLTAHALRRAFCSLHVAAGTSLWKVKSWCGHSSTAVTEKSYCADITTFDADINRAG